MRRAVVGGGVQGVVDDVGHRSLREPGLSPPTLGDTTDAVHALGPADLSTIYNAPNSLNAKPPALPINGDSITVGVIGRSNINLSDIQEFRGLFGLPSTFVASNIVLNGPDPTNLGGDEEIEAVLDASWAGAAAPTAIIDFVVSQTTDKIVIKVPSVKAGEYNISVQEGNAILIEPVRFTVQ